MIRHPGRFICFMLCIVIIININLCDNSTAEAASIKLSKTKLTLDLGMSYTLKVTGTSQTIKWTSSDKKIVNVTSKGTITALAQGTASITASVSGKKLSCKTTVTNEISDNWKDFALIINGELYKLPFDYKQLQDAGWDFDLKEYGLDKYMIEPGDVLSPIFKLEHAGYDSDIYIGFENTGDKKNAIKKCKVYAISINNKYAQNPISVILPGGIKSGSSALDVLEAYDDPDESYKSDFGYWNYQYCTENDIPIFELLINDEGGLFDIVYKNW